MWSCWVQHFARKARECDVFCGAIKSMWCVLWGKSRQCDVFCGEIKRMWCSFIQTFTLPSLSARDKFKLTAHEGAKIRRIGFINFRSRSGTLNFRLQDVASAWIKCASACAVECRILQSGGCGFESQPGLLCTKVYSAFHPSGVRKWYQLWLGIYAGIAHSTSGWWRVCR